MVRLLLFLLVPALALVAFGWWITRPETVAGRVVDFDTRAPIPDVPVEASRQGWSMADFSFHTYTDQATTDGDGRFEVELRGSGRVRLRVVSEAHHALSGRFVPGRVVEVPLKARLQRRAGYPAWAGGEALVGVAPDGRPFGWRFAEAAATFSAEEADVFPVGFSPEADAPLVLRAHPHGGIACEPRDALGLDGDIDEALLLYFDEAPSDGYVSEASFETAHPGAACFVRTRDGRRYARMAVEPGGGMRRGGTAPGVGAVGAARSLPFVVGYFPGRALPYTRAAARPDIAAAALDLDTAPPDPNRPRTFRFEIRDEADRVIDRAEVTLRPGETQSAVGAPQSDWPAYRYDGVQFVLDERGLPVLGFTIHGHRVASHHGVFRRGADGGLYEPGRDPAVGPYDGTIPNRRFGVGAAFTDYTATYAPVARSYRVRVLPSTSIPRSP